VAKTVGRWRGSLRRLGGAPRQGRFVSPVAAVAALWRRMRALWPRWTLLPAAPFVLWSGWCIVVRREWRWELIALMLVTPLLAYFSPRTKRIFVGVVPLLLTGLMYDAMRFVQGVGVSQTSVHVCDLRQTEAALFGLDVGGVRVTLQDYLQQHSSIVADAYFAIPYGVYLLVAVGYGLYLGITDLGALRVFSWTFFALNFAGFLTYHLYPAAPPWYFHAHGCRVDLAAVASEGPNLARIDRLLGFGYFHGLYGRSHDVFGAIPSLHVTYPVLMLLVGWAKHGARVRAAMSIYAASMIVGAVYLDHHWILDVLIGLAYVLAIHALVRATLAVGGSVAEVPATVVAAEAPSRRRDVVARGRDTAPSVP
jgi:membrane-associated phospholipid phosphatase